MDEENNNNNINNHVGNGGRDEELHQLFKGMMLGLIRETTASWAHNRQHFDQQQQQPPFDNNTPIGSDIKLRLPDKYDGTRDISTIENFFSQIDKLKTLKGWDDYKTYNIVTTILDGRALAWVNYLEKLDNESTPRTWTELKEVLETKFKPTNGEDMYRDLLWKTKQETSVQEYVDKFMDICILIPDIGDKDLCDRFVRGLKSKELIAQIRTIPINTRTLEVATQAALAYKAAHDPAIAQSHATFARITPQPPRNSRYEPMDLDVIDRRNDNRSGGNNYNNNNSSGRGGRGGRGRGGRGRGGGNRSAGSSVVCYDCNGTGHFARDCPDRIAVIVKHVVAAMKKNNNGRCHELK